MRPLVFVDAFKSRRNKEENNTHSRLVFWQEEDKERTWYFTEGPKIDGIKVGYERGSFLLSSVRTKLGGHLVLTGPGTRLGVLVRIECPRRALRGQRHEGIDAIKVSWGGIEIGCTGCHRVVQGVQSTKIVFGFHAILKPIIPRRRRTRIINATGGLIKVKQNDILLCGNQFTQRRPRRGRVGVRIQAIRQVGIFHDDGIKVGQTDGVDIFGHLQE
eukprot:scaffold1982_cov93-Amphora_coffeaeformis.AAC.39